VTPADRLIALGLMLAAAVVTVAVLWVGAVALFSLGQYLQTVPR
jgi:hypothetical protein